MKPRQIMNREGKKLYLSRWYLMGDGGPSDVQSRGSRGLPAIFGLNIYLHCIHLSDDAGAVHNHPWRWALSLILRRGYYEWRLDKQAGELILRRYRPFTFNFLTEKDFHRVELVRGKPAWTLFITGRRIKTWGFLNGNVFTPWKIFLQNKRNV
jgi:hypothetical protein